jgi:hypothetical protein
MARKKLTANAPVKVNQLPKNEWVSGRLLEIRPPKDEDKSRVYVLKKSNGELLNLYGCYQLDNAVSHDHIGGKLFLMFKGEVPLDNGYKCNDIDIEFDDEDKTDNNNTQLLNQSDTLIV